MLARQEKTQMCIIRIFGEDSQGLLCRWVRYPRITSAALHEAGNPPCNLEGEQDLPLSGRQQIYCKPGI